MAKIGIMGGTFDPIHNGHLMLGRQARDEYELDEIWYMPSGQPPHKSGKRVTSAEDRLEMVRLATREERGFVCSDFEIRRPGITYSSETLQLLKEEYPQHEFYFIIGADSFYEIEKWHHPWEVMELTTLMVAGRSYEKAETGMDEHAAYLKEKYGARIVFLHCPEMDVSSTEIRNLAAAGKSPAGLVPQETADYMIRHQLYAPAGEN